MANSGKNSNSSQFFFTLGPAPQCDGEDGGVSWL
jgi:cyclophilin family peptidyl-prolyl cis-trans isomerase